MKLYVGLVIFIALLQACHTKQADNSNPADAAQHDIRIQYSDLIENELHSSPNRYIHLDSFYLFFESGFNAHLLEVYINGDRQLIDTLSTHPILSLAAVHVFGEMENIFSVGIRINYDDLLFIEPSKDQNIWLINYTSSVLTAQYTSREPRYD